MAETQKKPFAFELVYEIPGEETLRNVLLTENRALQLRATNILIRDDETIVLNPVTSVAPNTYHFLLQFKTGLLAPGTTTSPSSDWKVLRQENATLETTDIYLGWSGAAKRLEAGETLSIPLNGLFSASGARPTLPMLLSWPEPQIAAETGASATAPLFIEPRFPGQPGEYETEAYLILQKMQWGGRTRIPLRLDTVGPHQVLNVDNQLSTLVLRLTHSAPPGSQEENVVFNYSPTQPTQSSYLQLELPVGTVTARPFALATADQANGITLSMTGFSAASGVTSPDGTKLSFKLTPTATLTLKPGEYRELTLTNVVTGHPSGRVEVALAWVQVAGFRDGKLTCTLEKAPLIFGRAYAENIGIGGGTTAWARATLKTDSRDYGLHHTDGTVSLGTRVDNTNATTAHRGAQVGTKTDHPLHFFTKDGSPQVTLLTNGSLGIGNTNPSAPLDVKGNVLIQDGKLGIGTTSPEAALDVRGDAVIQSGKLGIRNLLPLAPLDVRGNAIIMDGKLGVGTTSPTAALEVNGDVVIQNGNLGIGTTSPAAALDVNGDIFIKGKKPFVVKSYDYMGGTFEIDTGFATTEWIGCVAGVSIFSLTPLKIVTHSLSMSGTYQLNAEVKNETGTNCNVRIHVLFIRKALAEYQ